MARTDKSLLFPALFGLVVTCFGLGATATDVGGQHAPSIPSYRLDFEERSAPLKPFKGSRHSGDRYPCQIMVGADESALCAQWLSAKASEDSAYWAKWSFWVGLAGLIGLLISLAYTRKALISAAESSEEAKKSLTIAERNATAASKQADISEDTARRTLRAYLHIKHLRVSDLTHQQFRIGIRAINHGQTPAHDISHYHATDIFETDAEYPFSEPEKSDFSGDAPVAKGEAYNGFMEPWAGEPQDNPAARIELYYMLNCGSHIMHLRGWIDYKDVFGCPHRSEYHVCLGGPGGAELRAIEGEVGVCLDPWYARDGNDAT